MSEETERLASTHTELGPAPLWKRTHPVEHLPDYVENIAAALQRNGMDESEAIATAINSVKRWQHPGEKIGHGHVHPEVVQASGEAVAEWERLKAAKQSKDEK
jgi:hypothetical protein